MITVYICDQTKPCRHKNLWCSKYGGECRHTKDIRYAKYKGKPGLERALYLERVWYEYHGTDTRWEME